LFLAFVSSANANTSFHENEINDLVTDCQFTYVVDNDDFSVTITTISAPHIKVKVLDASWNLLFTCTDNCSNPVVVNNLPIGEYVITVMYFDEDWDNTCITTEKFEMTGGPCVDNDEDGLCAFEDCNDYDATLPQPVGTACNDYDGTTINDQIQEDGCTCMGTPYQGDCNINYNLNADDGYIYVSGLIAHSAKLRIYDPTDWSTVYSCDNDCTNEVFAMGVSEGYYNIDIILYDIDFNEICSLNEYFTWDPSTCTDNDLDGICVAADCDDNNPTLPGTPGASCDDQNSATINDMVGEQGCTCAGEVYLGLCNISYLTSSNGIDISGLIAPHVKVRVFDADWNKVFECFDDCDQELAIAGLNPNEQHYLKVRLMDDDWQTTCTMEEYFVVEAGNSCEDTDADGYCDDVDCDINDPTWPKAPGTPCDDGQDLTINDVIQSDGCSCAGEEQDNSDPCGSIYVSESDGTIFIGGFPEGYIANVKLFVNWNLIFECTADCEDPTKIAELPTGQYVVTVKLLDNDWEYVCSIEETITLFVENPEELVVTNEWDATSEIDLPNAVSDSELTNTESEITIENSDKTNIITNAVLYPNPVTADLHINIDAITNEQSVLEIYNQLGQVVKQKEVDSWPEGALVLNCQALNAGVYYLVVRTATGSVVSKQFVKKP